jgi:hypothetical protein
VRDAQAMRDILADGGADVAAAESPPLPSERAGSRPAFTSAGL